MNFSINVGEILYSKNGKEIFPRLGMTIYDGSFRKVGNEFQTIRGNYIVCKGENDIRGDYEFGGRAKMMTFNLKKI
jgi:hypothetical protein